MAEAELDLTVIKRTQETLGKFVKKPPLSEKLLKKPPFRFLHDLFKAVIKDTGFFDGLYTADELNFESIKDRDDKMRFLQKMIDVVKLTTANDLQVRTSKIVAGHEAERTNELLQLMGGIIEKEMAWQKAVRAVTGAGGDAPIANGAVKKESNKAAKTKEKEKPKAKEKLNGKAAKEIKSKEGQSKKSTPSPEDKTVKRAIKAAPKEKVLSRQATFEKISKEKDKEKEKVTKKSKESKDVPPAAAKTKDERKRATPSPVKPLTNKAPQNNNKETTKITKLENGDAKIENKARNIQLNESLSKQQSTENSILPQKLDDSETTTGELQIENGHPKSTENLQRKSASSGKSRRSSASKQKSTEVNLTAESDKLNANESLKSLKAVNEAEVESLAEPQKAQQVIPPPQTMQATKEIKREPTFTHENSRDSVASNSNSSNTRPRTSLRPPSARPPSARPGAPRRRDKNIEIILQPNDQVKMSNVNVKLETFGDLDDDGENLVIIEDATTSADNLLSDSNDVGKLETEKLEQQGHLVQQILETQKELVQQNGEIGLKTEKDTLEPVFDANTRQSSALQMNNLRDIIQSLTKSVNPFGKLMDFIPEDIDAMQLELNMWRDNYTQAASDLKREKSLTESATEPLKNQLIQIDANIKEYLEMVDASRVKVLQNSDKISKMLLEQ